MDWKTQNTNDEFDLDLRVKPLTSTSVSKDAPWQDQEELVMGRTCAFVTDCGNDQTGCTTYAFSDTMNCAC